VNDEEENNDEQIQNDDYYRKGGAPLRRGSSCGDPPHAMFGSVKVTGYTPGATAVYSCNKGFQLKGGISLKCGANGWEGSEPSCLHSKETLVNCNVL